MPTRTTIIATNDVIDANLLNSLAGAWNPYTPTMSGFTPGNGTAEGSYLQFGKLVLWRALFTFGSTSSVAAGSSPVVFSLPVAAIIGAWKLEADARFYDSSASTPHLAACAGLSTTTMGVYALSGSQFVYPSNTAPFGTAWGSGDWVSIAGTYEAA